MFISCFPNCYLTDPSCLTLSLGTQRWVTVVAMPLNILMFYGCCLQHIKCVFMCFYCCCWCFGHIACVDICWEVFSAVWVSCRRSDEGPWVHPSASPTSGTRLQQHCWDGKHSHSVMSQWALGNPETSGRSYGVGGSFDYWWQWSVPFTEKNDWKDFHEIKHWVKSKVGEHITHRPF